METYQERNKIDSHKADKAAVLFNKNIKTLISYYTQRKIKHYITSLSAK